jgi:hypothetical protein
MEKKDKYEKNYLKPEFLPYCEEEWVSSEFDVYLGCSPPISDLRFETTTLTLGAVLLGRGFLWVSVPP